MRSPSYDRAMYYVLGEDGRTPVPAEPMEWANGFEAAKERPHKTPEPGDGWARVAETMVGERSVSTVFLGLDHAFFGGRPLLFETMVFAGSHESEGQWRYSTWDEALAGHDQVVLLVQRDAS
jgi:hypothetical protein